RPHPGAILCAPDAPGEIARPNIDVVSALVHETHAEHTAALTEITDAVAPDEGTGSADAVEDECANDSGAEESAARGPRTAPTRPAPEATPLISPAGTADTEHASRLVTLRN